MNIMQNIKNIPEFNTKISVISMIAAFLVTSTVRSKFIHPLLGDIISNQETRRNLANALYPALGHPIIPSRETSKLPTNLRGDPLFSIVILDHDTPQSSTSSLSQLHTISAPVALIVGPSERWKHLTEESTCAQARPFSFLVYIGHGNPRLRLMRIFLGLRNVRMWYNDATAVIIFADDQPNGPRDAQRSMERGDVYRGIGLVPIPINEKDCYHRIGTAYKKHYLTKFDEGYTETMSRIYCVDNEEEENSKNKTGNSNSIPYVYVCVILASSIRPQRMPSLAKATEGVAAIRLVMRPNVRHHALIATVYASGKDAETCENGDHDWFRTEPMVTGYMVAKSLGIRLLCQTEEDLALGNRLLNGTYLGLAKFVASGRADIMLQDVGIDLDWLNECDLLYPHTVQGFCIWVKRAGLVAFLSAVVEELRPEVWACVAGSLFAFSLVRGLAIRAGFIEPVFETYRTFITCMFPRRGRTVVMGVAMGLSAFGVFVGALMQSAISSCLTAPPLEADIDTLEEVDSNLHSILTFAGVRESIEESGELTNTIYELIQKFTYVLDGSMWLEEAERASFHKGYGLMLYDSQAFFLQSNRYVTNGYMLLHKVKECMVSGWPMVFPMKKNSPYTLVMEKKLRRAVDVGLTEKYRSIGEYGLKVAYDIVPIKTGAYRKDPYPLAIRHLQGVFALLGYGLVVATVALISEWIVKCVLCSNVGMNKRRKRKLVNYRRRPEGAKEFGRSTHRKILKTRGVWN